MILTVAQWIRIAVAHPEGDGTTHRKITCDSGCAASLQLTLSRPNKGEKVEKDRGRRG